MNQTTLDQFKTQPKRMEMILGVEKTVMNKEGTEITGCHFCAFCKDTGYSYICTKTGEKLEGFDSQEDKDNNNLTTLLYRNILVGVGHNCPLTTIHKDRMTKIKHTVSLEYIAEFVEDETYNGVKANIDEDENKLILSVFIYDDGYENDRDYKLDELSDIVSKVEDKFNVVVEDGEDDDDYSSVIVSLS